MTLLCITLVLMIIIAIFMPKIQINFFIHPESGVASEKLHKPKAFYLKEWEPKDKVNQQLKPEQKKTAEKLYRTYLEKRQLKKDINQRIVSIITGGFMILSMQNISQIILLQKTEAIVKMSL